MPSQWHVARLRLSSDLFQPVTPPSALLSTSIETSRLLNREKSERQHQANLHQGAPLPVVAITLITKSPVIARVKRFAANNSVFCYSSRDLNNKVSDSQTKVAEQGQILHDTHDTAKGGDEMFQ